MLKCYKYTKMYHSKSFSFVPKCIMNRNYSGIWKWKVIQRTKSFFKSLMDDLNSLSCAFRSVIFFATSRLFKLHFSYKWWSYNNYQILILVDLTHQNACYVIHRNLHFFLNEVKSELLVIQDRFNLNELTDFVFISAMSM